MESSHSYFKLSYMIEIQNNTGFWTKDHLKISIFFIGEGGRKAVFGARNGKYFSLPYP